MHFHNGRKWKESTISINTIKLIILSLVKYLPNYYILNSESLILQKQFRF